MPFVTWTRFELPDSVLFTTGIPYRDHPEYDSRLIDAMGFILSAPDHELSCWGRVSERPEKIILVSSWGSEGSLIAFKATSEYLQYWTGISDISSIAPVEQQIGNTFGWPFRLRGKINFFSISFPSPVSAITRGHFEKAKNCLQAAGGVGLGKEHLAPYSFPPTKLWLLDTQEIEGTTVETMLHICWWGSEKKEKDFKEYRRLEEPENKLEIFKRRAHLEGAIHFEEEHCSFVHIALRD